MSRLIHRTLRCYRGDNPALLFGAGCLLVIGFIILALHRAVAGDGPVLDTDRDGLSDDDERNLYHTDPNNPDTDGDGQSDGDEVRAGTDPLSASSVFRLVGPPVRQPNGQWRVTWSSVTNKVYKLQRRALVGDAWTDVTSVTASNTTAFADDASPAGGAHQVYRVLLVEPGQKPVVSTPIPLPGGGWRVTWTSLPGKTYQLLRADRVNAPTAAWIAIATVTAGGSSLYYDDLTSGARSFYRVRETQVIAVAYQVTDPTRFVPIGTNGAPVEGAIVTNTPAGSLPPFQFRPGGNSAAGVDQGLTLKFPAGAIQTNVNGQAQIAFTNLVVTLGSNSPIQFPVPLTYHSTNVQYVPVGPLDVATLSSLFKGNPTSGVEVVAFGLFPLTLTAGVLDDSGVRGARIDARAMGMAMPANSGQYPDFNLDLNDPKGIRIPFSGEFELPD
ncbi:MAG TPA: thrombospondin type 3 repeat-containing protein, partial [Candidatus Nitrosotalea sp.]|nr:thrombospondin type 3 repeat-containing protein [Candidatus Nitrosotalea sp.]